MSSLTARAPRVLAAVAALLGLAAAIFLGVSSAKATNQGSASGDATQGCSVAWNASAVLDADLQNDDPEYPGLMVGLDGQPTASYTNGGYITEVSPAFGNPGLLEMNHFYNGSGAGLTQVWRIPTATDRTILGAKVTFTLPAEVRGLPVTFDATSTNAGMRGWGGAYANYTWSPRASAVDNGDGTWTVDLGDLPAGAATVYQFTVAVGAAFTPNDRFVASADLTGTYAPGTNGGNCPIADAPAAPTPSADLPACTAEFLGQTLWSVYDRDITVRDKVTGETGGDLLGEVNADGWGAGAWGEGDTRTFRLYAATTKPLTDVTYVIDAVQGMTFGSVSTTADTPGGGKLQANGYKAKVSGVTITKVSDTQISVHIDRMPANSSVSFNATGVLDGSKATMALNHRLTGQVLYCEPRTATTTETSAWSVPDCDERTVTLHEHSVVTRWVWNPSILDFEQVEEATDSESVRPMTEDELAECPATEPSQSPTPSATAEPTDTPAPTAPATPGHPDQPGTPGAPGQPGAPAQPLASTGAEGFLPLAAISAVLLLAGAAVLAVMRRRDA